MSAVVATCDRPNAIQSTLESLLTQHCVPAELVVVDASAEGETRQHVAAFERRVDGLCTVKWLDATVRGAAPQRNQGLTQSGYDVIWFFDDDIAFEPECVARLWSALQSDPTIGGVNAMITNQRYTTPGAASRTMFALLDGGRRGSFAGRVIGPAVNLLPEDRDDLPDVVPVEWLNTTCTMYRRQALPTPAFDAVFTGRSVMEDLALSLRVGQQWRLVNARTARIFHDSQSRPTGSDPAAAAMESYNRHYVMTAVLGRRGPADYCRLFAWDAFQVAASLASRTTRASSAALIRGKWQGYGRAWRDGGVAASPQHGATS